MQILKLKRNENKKKIKNKKTKPVDNFTVRINSFKREKQTTKKKEIKRNVAKNKSISHVRNQGVITRDNKKCYYRGDKPDFSTSQTH